MKSFLLEWYVILVIFSSLRTHCFRNFVTQNGCIVPLVLRKSFSKCKRWKVLSAFWHKHMGIFAHIIYQYKCEFEEATVTNKKPKRERIISAADAASSANDAAADDDKDHTMRVLFLSFTESHVQIYIYGIWMGSEKKFKRAYAIACVWKSGQTEKKSPEWMSEALNGWRLGKKSSAVLLRRMP